jgi:zinc protease
VNAAARLAAEAFTSVPPKCDIKLPKDAAPRKVDAREVYIKPTTKKTAVVYVAYPGTDVFNRSDRAPLDVLDTILTGMNVPGNWLHEELRGKGLVYEVHAYSLLGLRPGYVAAQAVCQPEKVPEVVRIIEADMARAVRDPFTPTEVDPARATLLVGRQLARETIDGWAFETAVDEVLGLGYEFPQQEIEDIRAVRPQAVARVAQQYLTKPVIVVLTSDPDAAEAIRK